MNQASQRDLRILTAIAERQDLTQRGLSDRVGIALGLTNLYLKRLVRKGYIKVTTIPANRVRYLLTATGLAEKSRLTYEYMAYSLRLYREARERLRSALEPLVAKGRTRFVLYGSGEAAELAYLTLREFGFEPAAIYDGSAPRTFLNLPVRPVGDIVPDEIDYVIVAAFDPPDAELDELKRRGVTTDKLIFLVSGAEGGPVQ